MALKVAGGLAAGALALALVLLPVALADQALNGVFWVATVVDAALWLAAGVTAVVALVTANQTKDEDPDMAILAEARRRIDETARRVAEVAEAIAPIDPAAERKSRLLQRQQIIMRLANVRASISGTQDSLSITEVVGGESERERATMLRDELRTLKIEEARLDLELDQIERALDSST